MQLFARIKKLLNPRINNVKVDKKYYFGDINFIGNTVYSNNSLQQILGLNKGDVYNGVLLKKRIADTSKPDGNDITNLYQNNGYLFSIINAVEVSAINYKIDFGTLLLDIKTLQKEYPYP